MYWLYSITVKGMASSEIFLLLNVQVNGVNIYLGGVMNTVNWVVINIHIPTYIYTHSHVHKRTHIHTAKNKTSTEKYVDRYNEWKNEVIWVVEAEKD